MPEIIFPLNTLSVKMRVDFSSANVRMTEHKLNRAEICPAFKKMRGKAMPERVRRNLAFDPGFERSLLDQLENRDPAQCLAITA
jgi:hypothetical protein